MVKPGEVDFIVSFRFFVNFSPKLEDFLSQNSPPQALNNKAFTTRPLQHTLEMCESIPVLLPAVDRGDPKRTPIGSPGDGKQPLG